GSVSTLRPWPQIGARSGYWCDLDWYDTVAELTAEQRSAAFDGLARELGISVAPGTLWTAWTAAPAWERPPLEEAWCGSPNFATFAVRWADAGERLLAQHGADGGGERFAATQARIHADALPFPDAVMTVARLGERCDDVPRGGGEVIFGGVAA